MYSCVFCHWNLNLRYMIDFGVLYMWIFKNSCLVICSRKYITEFLSELYQLCSISIITLSTVFEAFSTKFSVSWKSGILEMFKSNQFSCQLFRLDMVRDTGSMFTLQSTGIMFSYHDREMSVSVYSVSLSWNTSTMMTDKQASQRHRSDDAENTAPC